MFRFLHYHTLVSFPDFCQSLTGSHQIPLPHSWRPMTNTSSDLQLLEFLFLLHIIGEGVDFDVFSREVNELPIRVLQALFGGWPVLNEGGFAAVSSHAIPPGVQHAFRVEYDVGTVVGIRFKRMWCGTRLRQQRRKRQGKARDISEKWLWGYGEWGRGRHEGRPCFVQLLVSLIFYFLDSILFLLW